MLNWPSRELEDVSDLPLLGRRFPLTMFIVQGALAWLEDNQDKALDELKAAKPEVAEEGFETSVSPLEGGENANSLVCNECGKKFRSHAAASFHASKT